MTADVAAQLGDGHRDPARVAGPGVAAAVGGAGSRARSSGYAWVADALGALPGSGIVYVLTVAETERLAGFLRDRGIDVGRVLGADAATARQLEDRLRDNEIKAVVATSALGMGYDKPDLALLRPPRLAGSPVGLLPAGRPGRAGPRRRRRRAACPAGPTSGSGSTSPPRASRRPTQVERVLDALARRRRVERARGRGGDRAPPRPARDAAEDPRRRRRRSSARGGGWDRHRRAVARRRGEVGGAARRSGRPRPT